MSWRTVIVSKSAKLDYQMGYLVVRQETITKINLNEIGMLLIESTAVSLTTYLLAELTERKIKVIFCGNKRNPCSELLPYYGSHDTSMKIRKQINWEKENKTSIWTYIVTEKIQKQKELLEFLGKKEGCLLEGYIQEMKFGDVTNREGHAAKVYFNALFGKEFSRGTDTSINAALNYGYSIILSCFTREITANGYLTQLGLYHDNMFNPFNLASDLMEPFRPLIDKKVVLAKFNQFTKEEKHEMVSIVNDEVYIADRKEYVSNAIKVYCKSIFDALEEKDGSLIRFYKNEL